MEMLKYEDIKIFKDNLSSFKDTSRDSDGKAPKYMTNSEIQVINFDKVKESYIKEMNLSDTPCSSDALYIGKEEKLFFIEFKNGVMKNNKIYNVYNKIYDSSLIFNDIVQKNISFCRENVYFVLVYNEEKNFCKKNEMKQQDSSKIAISKHFHKKAKKKFIRFGLEKFEKIYFKGVFTYTEKEFEDNFLSKIDDNTHWDPENLI